MTFSADFHYGVIIALRSIQGFSLGLTWPAMYAVVGYWIPLEERSRKVWFGRSSFLYAGTLGMVYGVQYTPGTSKNY
ncbi:hypothetical protein DOY81_010828 [Sarcophaga bullata]|nr:hypothetical protein DOY81_010828 [Sarcophaga bullata]